MIAYTCLLLVPCLFSAMRIGNRNSGRYLFFIGVFYVIFIGLRQSVGVDWHAYELIYEEISVLPLGLALLRQDPGFALLNWLLIQFDTGVYGVNVVVAIIFVSGLIRIAKMTPIPWLALVAVTPYLVIAVAMSGVRQAAAIGLFFHLIASWRSGKIKKLFIAATAVTFHSSAIVSLFLVLQSLQLSKWMKRFVLVTIGLLILYIFSQSAQFGVYQQRYFVNKIDSPGALQHVLLNAIPGVIYLFFIQKWKNLYGKNPLMVIFSLLSILSVFLVPLSSTVVDRLALFLTPIQMLVYGSLPVVFKKPVYAFYIVCVHFFILYVWLLFSNSSWAFIPYDNVLFHLL